MSTVITTIGTSGILAYSAIAEGDLVKIDTTNSTPTQLYAIPTAADTDKPFGVALAAADAGEPVQYQKLELGSIIKARSAGSISVGAQVSPAAAGECQTAVTGDWMIGIALTAGTTADDEFQLQITGGYLVA